MDIILDKPTDEQISKMLKTTLNVNSFIINQHGTINIGSVNTVINKQNNKDILEDWLKSNPIKDRIKPSDYRQQFFDDTGVNIHPNTFGKIASKYVNTISSGRYYQAKN